MVVQTSTPAVDKARRLALDLIVADHPLECLTCRKNGRCELQSVAAYMGVTESRLRPTRRQMPMDTTNPFYDRDMAKCILCGRCVRACDEIRAVHAIDYVGRSAQAKIGTAMDRPIITSNCESCGQCVDTCPVGALVDRKWAGLPDREVKTVCPYCGCGCGVVLKVKGGRIVGAEADREHPASKGSLCVKGRFGLDFVHHAERLTTPLIKREGKFVEASWDEALDLVAERLAASAGSFAALASAKCTNEENYLLQKFTRGVMGTNNIDHCARI
jgi:predicted molibdopterin-dependent oxidoreductase YjgC